MNKYTSLRRLFATELRLTEYESRKMLKEGISPMEIKKFTTEKYSRSKDTKELIDQLYFGDSNWSRQQRIA